MTTSYIDKSAHVSANAVIGNNCKIWVNSQIRENACIGDGTIVSKDTYIDQGVQIGQNCKIQNGVSIYSGVTIQDDVFVGPNSTFTNDLVPRAFNQNWQITPTLIKKGASIGANATIICGVVIGEYAMVAAGSVVTKDVPDYTLVMGNPARAVSKINKLGYKISAEDLAKEIE